MIYQIAKYGNEDESQPWKTVHDDRKGSESGGNASDGQLATPHGCHHSQQILVPTVGETIIHNLNVWVVSQVSKGLSGYRPFDIRAMIRPVWRP